MAGLEGTQVKTGVGRVVWGNPGEETVKRDPNTKQPVLRDGQQVKQWAFGIAFPKAEFAQIIWPAMQAEQMKGYPQGVPQRFAWKYVDGDGNDSEGKPFRDREGYAGCYVLTISTEAFAPPIYKWENGGWVQMAGNQVKCGDYFALSLNIKINVPTERTHTPGLYINPLAIEFVGYGTEIRTVADPNKLLGTGGQHQLPPGASMTPMSSAPGVGMPGTGMPMQQPGQMPPGYGQQPPQQSMGTPPGYPPQQMPQQQWQQPPAPGGMPGQMPPPAPDFTRNAGMQQPGQMPPGYGQQPPQQPMGTPPGYPPQQMPQQQWQQPPAPGGMPMQQPGQTMPGQMPGMMPPR